MSVVDVLLNKIDVVQLVGEYTELNSDSKGNARGICPIHKGDNPTSLTIIDDKIVYCFSCGFSGDAISFYAEVNGYAYYQAVEELAEKYNINLDNNEQYQKHKSIVKTNTHQMVSFQKEIGVVKDFLIQKRGFTEEAIKEFNIGYCDDPDFLKSKKNKDTIFPGIIFPIHDIYGRCIGFSKRRIDGNHKPTYVNSYDDDVFDKRNTLYNLNRARKLIKDKKRIYIVEGYVDTISAHMQGLPCVGYISGSLTKGQIGLLKDLAKIHKDLEFIFAPDNPLADETGEKECVQIREKLLKYAPELINKSRFIVYPDNKHKDFNELHVDGIQIDKLETQSIDKAVLQIQLKKCEYLEREYDVVDNFMIGVKNELVRADIATMLAERWKHDIADVKKQLSIKTELADEKASLFKDVYACFKILDNAIEEEEQEETKLSLGYKVLDNNLLIRKKRVIVLGAYSNSGKTEMLIEWILHWVVRLKKNVIFFSLEMAAEDILEIIIAKIIGIQQYKVRDFRKTAEGEKAYQTVTDKIRKYLLIYDENDLSMDKMGELIDVANSNVFKDKPADIVCCDYYQYLEGIRTLEDDKIAARKMKATAKKYKVLFVMLSQFTKNSQRKDKESIQEPTQTDLMGAGDIGNSADIIILMWRPILFQKLTEIECKQLKYTTMVKITKGRGRQDNDTHFEFVYDVNKSKLNEVGVINNS